MPVQCTTNTDDIDATHPVALAGSNQPCLGMGWVRPTMLSLTTYMGKVGTTPGFQFGTGSSNASAFRVAAAITTDWAWETASGVFATDKWTFFAFLGICETATDTADCRVWIGTIQDPPILTSTTPTTGSGNVGSGGTGGFWHGRASSVSTGAPCIHDMSQHMAFGAIPTSTQPHPLWDSTTYTISANMEKLALEKFILPFWEGRLGDPKHWGRDSNRYCISNSYLGPQNGTIAMDLTRRGWGWNNYAPTLAPTGTVAAAGTQERGPRGYMHVDPTLLWRRR